MCFNRDIKCANILVTSNGSVKLSDFGLAKEVIIYLPDSFFWTTVKLYFENIKMILSLIRQENLKDLDHAREVCIGWPQR